MFTWELKPPTALWEQYIYLIIISPTLLPPPASLRVMCGQHVQSLSRAWTREPFISKRARYPEIDLVDFSNTYFPALGRVIEDKFIASTTILDRN